MKGVDQSGRLYDLLHTALRQALDERKPDREWHFKPCSVMEEVIQKQAIILTLASFRFRLICLLHIDMSLGGLTHEVLAGQLSEGSNMDHEDYIREFGNSVCGYLKRDMQGGVPPLGMSTPNILHHGSLEFLEKTGHGCAAHLTVSVADGEQFRMGASLLLYPHEDYSLEIPRIVQDAGEDEGGELELF